MRRDDGFVVPALLLSPVVIVGLVGALGLGTFWLMDVFEDRRFRNDITALTQDLRTEREANATLRLQVSTHETNLERLTATIAEMNARLDAMNARARQIESAANLRVARAIRAGEEATKALLSKDTHVPPGHLAMNDWLTMRLTP